MTGLFPDAAGSPAAPDTGESRPVEARLAQWVTFYCELWGYPEIAATCEVTFSGRLQTSLGIAYLKPRKIRLHKTLVTGEHEHLLPEVLCHELAHLVVYSAHANCAKPHGAEWRALMRAAGFEPRVRHNLQLPRSQPLRQVAHLCTRCGAGRIARRVMNHWRCSRCMRAGFSGELVVRRVR